MAPEANGHLTRSPASLEQEIGARLRHLGDQFHQEQAQRVSGALGRGRFPPDAFGWKAPLSRGRGPCRQADPALHLLAQGTPRNPARLQAHKDPSSSSSRAPALFAQATGQGLLLLLTHGL